jgi:trk system potassium uptake protein
MPGVKINIQAILRIWGLLLLINAAFLLVPVPFTIYYKEGDLPAFLFSAFINALLGAILFISTRKITNKDLRRKDGFLVVASGWFILSIFGSLPFLVSGAIPDISNALFETISGYTTTGATILTDIEALPKGILLWRSLTQWIGGMGIIVLAVAILPLLGVGGMQLFVAEAPGISPDKLTPRIKETAKRLWYIYLGLTLLQTVLMMAGGMNLYEAFATSLSTLSTGGFSPKNASIGHFDSGYIQYVVIVFMFLGGVSFTLIYFGIKRNFSRIFQNEEFKVYTLFVIGLTLFVSIVLFTKVGYDVEKAFRMAAFQVIAIITTTGFATDDFTAWTPLLTMVFFFLLFSGGSAGSTSGGIKFVRHILLGKNTILEFKRQLHPSAIIPVRLNGKSVPREVISNVLAFIIIYFTAVGIGTLLLAISGLDFESALSAVASSVGNVGPGLGTVGPSGNFNHLSDFSKWVLSFCMIIGRLELITVIIIFTPNFWARN